MDQKCYESSAGWAPHKGNCETDTLWWLQLLVKWREVGYSFPGRQKKKRLLISFRQNWQFINSLYFPLKSSPTFIVELHQSFVNSLYFQINPCCAVFPWHLAHDDISQSPSNVVFQFSKWTGTYFLIQWLKSICNEDFFFFSLSYLRSDLDLAYIGPSPNPDLSYSNGLGTGYTMMVLPELRPIYILGLIHVLHVINFLHLFGFWQKRKKIENIGTIEIDLKIDLKLIQVT